MFYHMCYFGIPVFILLHFFVFAVEIKNNLNSEMNPMAKLMKKLPDRKAPESRATTTPPKRWKYKDYIRKFDATTLYERAERRYKRAGHKNVSRNVIYEDVMAGIDPTDELLRFKVDKTNWRELYGPEFRRAYLPPGTFLPRTEERLPGRYWERSYIPSVDTFGVRPRIFELMKQVIYQGREKMTYMQKLREELNQSAVFKMGYLFAKTDQTIKDYHNIVFKAYYTCGNLRQNVTKRLDGTDIMTMYERALMHWFEAELLWDLVNRNDRICKEVIEKHFFKRKEEFNKVFVD